MVSPCPCLLPKSSNGQSTNLSDRRLLQRPTIESSEAKATNGDAELTRNTAAASNEPGGSLPKRLPPEIWAMIISEAFDAFPDGHGYNIWTNHTARQHHPFRSSLLLVNHQLAEEAAAFIFQNTTFQINIWEAIERASDGSQSAAVESARRYVCILPNAI